MIVYVESNFVLELAFLQAEHERCAALLDLAEAGAIDLVMPSFSVGESYETWVRRRKGRSDLHGQLRVQMRELSRSAPYAHLAAEFQAATGILLRSAEEEKQRLDAALERLADTAQFIPIDAAVIKTAIDFQRIRDLSPQDAIMYASILRHLAGARPIGRCFVTRNARDFVSLDIQRELAARRCRLLTTFADALGYVRSQI